MAAQRLLSSDSANGDPALGVGHGVSDGLRPAAVEQQADRSGLAAVARLACRPWLGSETRVRVLSNHPASERWAADLTDALVAHLC